MEGNLLLILEGINTQCKSFYVGLYGGTEKLKINEIKTFFKTMLDIFKLPMEGKKTLEEEISLDPQQYIHLWNQLE